MESTKVDLHSQTVSAHDKIEQLFSSSKDLKVTEADQQDLGRILNRMYGRFEEDTCQATVDRLFKIALDKIEDDHSKKVVCGLRQMVRQAEFSLYRPNARFQDAFFFPNMANVKRLQKYISMAKKSIDLCIFSFTNDDLANEVKDAHNRGVKVRIITDDEAMKGKGADSTRMADAGIAVRCDSEERYHMHNKFMVVDSLFLVTGSFNWTFQAGKSNQENLVVLDGEYFIKKYDEEFNKLWGQFASNELERKQHAAATTIQKKYKSNQTTRRANNNRKKTNDPWGLE